MGMRAYICWISFSIFLSMGPLWASNSSSYVGTIRIDDATSKIFIYPQGDQKRYEIQVTDPLMESRLRCLKQGDNLAGHSSLIDDNTMNIESIEHVGLNELIGTWRGPDEVFKFVDSSSFYYWTKPTNETSFKGPFHYRYILSPYGDNPSQCKWKIFIVNPKRVVLGSLQRAGENRNLLELYDPDTGNVTATKSLKRIVTAKLRDLHLPQEPILTEDWKP